MTLKCVICFQTSLKLDDMNDAITVIEGNAVCISHATFIRKSDSLLRSIELVRACVKTSHMR